MTGKRPETRAADACPHCGAVLDVQLAMEEDGAALSKGRRHRSHLPSLDEG